MFGGLLNFFGSDDSQQQDQQPSWKANLTGVPDSNQALQGRGLGMGLLSAAAAVSNANRPSYHGARNTGDLFAQGAAGFGNGLGQFGAAQIQQSTARAKQLLEEQKAQREAEEFEWKRQQQAARQRMSQREGVDGDAMLSGGDSYYNAYSKGYGEEPWKNTAYQRDLHKMGVAHGYDKEMAGINTHNDMLKNGMVLNPDGTSISPLGGYIDAKAGLSGAEERAKNANKVHSFSEGTTVFDPGNTLNMGGATPTGSAPANSAADFTASKESGKQGSLAIGYDRTGGTSYGKFQIASGTMPSFLSWLGQNGKGNIAEVLRAAGNPNTGSRNGKMPETWKQLVQSGAITDAMQEQFIRDTHVKPALLSLPDELKLAIHTDPNLQSALFSTAVQHGPGGASKLFSRAWQKSGGDKQALLRNLYEGRMTQFGSSTPEVRAAVKNRLASEGQQLANGVVQTGANSFQIPKTEKEGSYKDKLAKDSAEILMKPSEKRTDEEKRVLEAAKGIKVLDQNAGENKDPDASRRTFAKILVGDVGKAKSLIKDYTVIPNTGKGGALTSWIPGTAANDLASTLETLESGAIMERLLDLKSQSSTGASGLGALSEKEGERLAASWGNLKQSQSEEQLLSNLDRYLETLIDVVFDGNVPEEFKDVVGGKKTPTRLRYNPQTGKIEQ